MFNKQPHVYLFVVQAPLQAPSQLDHFSTVTEVPEMCVLLAVHRWVQDYCLRSATKDDKSADFKTVMAPFLPKLRFLSLTVQEFVTFITSKGAASVISKEDAFDIMCVLVGNDSVELPS
ncbi:hypothetical protein V5799_007095, partial [Amblyomma americanum]